MVKLKEKADWWGRWKHSWEGSTENFAEGVRAYAVKQEVSQHLLGRHFARLWEMVYVVEEDDGNESDDNAIEPDSMYFPIE